MHDQTFRTPRVFAAACVVALLATIAPGETQWGTAHAQSPDTDAALQELHRAPLHHALEMERPFEVARAQRFIRDVSRYREAVDWGRSLRAGMATKQAIERCDAENVRRGIDWMEDRQRQLRELHEFFEENEARYTAWEQAVGELQRQLAAYVPVWSEYQAPPLRLDLSEGTYLTDELPVPPIATVVDIVATVLTIIPRASWELAEKHAQLREFIARDTVLDAWREVLLLARDQARDLRQRTTDYAEALDRTVSGARSEFLEHACEDQCLLPEEIAELERTQTPTQEVPIVHPRPTGAETRYSKVEHIMGDD